MHGSVRGVTSFNRGIDLHSVSLVPVDKYVHCATTDETVLATIFGKGAQRRSDALREKYKSELIAVPLATVGWAFAYFHIATKHSDSAAVSIMISLMILPQLWGMLSVRMLPFVRLLIFRFDYWVIVGNVLSGSFCYSLFFQWDKRVLLIVYVAVFCILVVLLDASSNHFEIRYGKTMTWLALIFMVVLLCLSHGNNISDVVDGNLYLLSSPPFIEYDTTLNISSASNTSNVVLTLDMHYFADARFFIVALFVLKISGKDSRHCGLLDCRFRKIFGENRVSSLKEIDMDKSYTLSPQAEEKVSSLGADDDVHVLVPGKGHQVLSNSAHTICAKLLSSIDAGVFMGRVFNAVYLPIAIAASCCITLAPFFLAKESESYAVLLLLLVPFINAFLHLTVLNVHLSLLAVKRFNFLFPFLMFVLAATVVLLNGNVSSYASHDTFVIVLWFSTSVVCLLDDANATVAHARRTGKWIRSILFISHMLAFGVWMIRLAWDSKANGVVEYSFLKAKVEISTRVLVIRIASNTWMYLAKYTLMSIFIPDHCKVIYCEYMRFFCTPREVHRLLRSHNRKRITAKGTTRSLFSRLTRFTTKQIKRATVHMNKSRKTIFAATNSNGGRSGRMDRLSYIEESNSSSGGQEEGGEDGHSDNSNKIDNNLARIEESNSSSGGEREEDQDDQ